MKFFPIGLLTILLSTIACTPNHTESNSSEKKEKPSTQKVEEKSIEEESDARPKHILLNQSNYKDYLENFLKDHPERKFKLTTRLGELKFRLFDDTPLHTANFIMLVDRGYFDQTEFTRVVKNFVVQGGNNEKESEEIKRLLIGNYTIESEVSPDHNHIRGALAMARKYEDNPEKRSAAYNFYFVEGQVFKEPQLLAIERDHEMRIEEPLRSKYLTIGGAPHLDGEHTVFGEIYEGLDVLKKMSEVETDDSQWPLEPLVMNIEVID